MAPRPCKECGRRPKAPGRHRCATCQLRQEPIGEQIVAARRRLSMVPEELRVKRTAKLMRSAPAGCGWCAGCQSWRDLEDFGKGATTCRACASARSHGAMVAKTYGLTAEQYDDLLKRQGGKCAICRNKPKSKRLAVDHDHGTGAVRGLLCSRCNHDLMGSAWDSMAMASSLWHYMNTPPAAGAWVPPELQAQLIADPSDATRRSKASGIDDGLIVANAGNVSQRPKGAAAAPLFTATDKAAGVLAGLELDVAGANALYRVLGHHLMRVDPPPF